MKTKTVINGIIIILLSAVVFNYPASAQEEPEEITPEVNIRFVYVMCNDVEEMAHFYTDLCRMNQTSYCNDEDWQWLCYDCEGFQLMFFGAHAPLEYIEEWVWQPGWGGDIDGTSWSIEYPEKLFKEVVQDIQRDQNVQKYTYDPEWRQDSYFGFTVKDPMGNSVELYCVPESGYDYSEDPEKENQIAPWQMFLLRGEYLDRF